MRWRRLSARRDRTKRRCTRITSIIFTVASTARLETTWRPTASLVLTGTTTRPPSNRHASLAALAPPTTRTEPHAMLALLVTRGLTWARDAVRASLGRSRGEMGRLGAARARLGSTRWQRRRVPAPCAPQATTKASRGRASACRATRGTMQTPRGGARARRAPPAHTKGRLEGPTARSVRRGRIRILTGAQPVLCAHSEITPTPKARVPARLARKESPQRQTRFRG